MRRAGPILIAVIGVLSLIIVFFPNLRIPDPTAPDGAWRTIETKLGLDLEGGLRVEYQALPKDGVQPTREALGVIKDIIERRVNTTGVSEPVVLIQGVGVQGGGWRPQVNALTPRYRCLTAAV